MNQISSALTETLRNDKLQGVAMDISEAFLDSAIDNEMLKGIPVIKTFLSINKGVSQIKDQLFLKKIVAFLSKSQLTSPEDRMRMIDKINNSKGHRVKLGEKLLYLIERLDDWHKAEILSIFFNEFIKGEISYGDFIKIAKILEGVTVYDLERFLELIKDRDTFEMDNDFEGNDDEVGDLINSGLFNFYIGILRVEDEDDWKMNRKYKIEGGNLIISISEMGGLIRKTLMDSVVNSTNASQ